MRSTVLGWHRERKYDDRSFGHLDDCDRTAVSDERPCRRWLAGETGRVELPRHAAWVGAEQRRKDGVDIALFCSIRG